MAGNPNSWHDRARAHALPVADKTGPSGGAVTKTVEALAAELVSTLRSSRTASINTATSQVSEQTAQFALRLAAITAGWNASEIEMPRPVNGVVVITRKAR